MPTTRDKASPSSNGMTPSWPGRPGSGTTLNLPSALVDDPALPHNRGGFVPPGNGSDARANTVIGATSGSGGDMLYLENRTFTQDWYIYPNGKDPLFAPSPSPTNYCRDGYRFLGAMPVTRSFNGLTQRDENPGSLHWVVLCGTGSDLLLQASNAGEASCPASYVTRGWFAKPTHLGTTTCTTRGVCSDQTSKAFVNLCVSSRETQYRYPAPHP